MGVMGFTLPETVRSTNYIRDSERSSIIQGFLFIAPSFTITVCTFILFALIRGSSTEQMNFLSVTIMIAVIASLIGTAWIQIILYRIFEIGKSFSSSIESFKIIQRGTDIGIVYAIIYACIISGALFPYFHFVLDFPLIYYIHCSILLLLFSVIWVLTATFWASFQYKYPALIFTLSFIIVIILSYGFYWLDHSYTITGYTIGVFILLILSIMAWRSAFFNIPEIVKNIYTNTKIPMFKLLQGNISPMLFNTLYVLAIFLDKIIVWTWQGIETGSGLVITGSYTTGAFLGLLPTFSIGVIAYFINRVRPLVAEMYSGTYWDIQERFYKYKRLYWSSLFAILISGLIMFVIVFTLCFYSINDPGIIKILTTTSIGVLLFIVIVYNSVVLPLFRKDGISAISMFVVCTGELVSIPFMTSDVWYGSIGFLIGSAIGCCISMFSIIKLFSEFEYSVFSHLTQTNEK